MISLQKFIPIWIALGFFAVLPSGLSGQDQQPARFQVSTNLILVDVRVLDAKGRPVTGLAPEEFTISEEGVPQVITYFQEISIPLTSVRLDTPDSDRTLVVSPPSRGGMERPLTPAADKRQLILLFNVATAGLQDAHMMRESAERFLETQFSEQDAAAVLVLNNGLQLLTDLTSDRTVLSQAIRSLSETRPETELSLPDEETSTEEDAAFVADETELALFETNQQLAAIQSIAEAFRDVTGRKALIYFSSGLTGRGIENVEQMRLTADICNRANISVYAVDSRGLVALSPGGGAHRGGGRGTGLFNGRAALNQLVSLNQSQEGLMTLAADTGGAALVDDNDFGKIFAKAREDASHYYLLGYHVETPTKDGRYRKIEVTTRIRYGRVEYRSGYYADKPYRSLSSAEREFQFLQAVIDDHPRADFPLQISAEFFPDTHGRYQVPVLLAFSRSQLSRLSGAKELDLEMIVLARSPAKVTQAGVRDRVEIRGGSDSETRFVYQNLLVLDPGRYTIAAFVRDNRTGLLSRSDLTLDLSPMNPVRHSSLVLAAGWRDPGVKTTYRITRGKNVTIVDNPLQVQNRLLIPRVGGHFTRQESILLHGKVGLVDGPPSGDYRIVVLDAEDRRLFESDWRPLSIIDERFSSLNARLPLSQLEPGRYRLVAEVRLADRETRFLTRDFTLNPPAP